MKILLVYPSPFSNVFFRSFIEGFVQAGHQVAVCTGQNGGEGDAFGALPAGTVTYQVDLPRGAAIRAHLAAIHGVREAVRRFRPDIVHAHMSAAVFTTAIARRWPQTTIGTFHGLMYPLRTGLVRYVMGVAERTAIKRLDQVQVVNRGDYDVVRHDLPRAECVMLRAGFGTDLRKFNPATFGVNDRAAIRRELGLRPDAVVGAFVGRMVEFKGIPTLVRAFRRVAEQHRVARLLIVGSSDPLHPTGLTTDEDCWLRHTDAIQITGFTDNPEKYLAAADYFVLPSVREGLSTAIMEALCMGLPVVTTSARGCGDLVEHGRTGLVVAPGDVAALETALLEMISSPESRRRQGELALAHRARLGRDECVREMIGIYQRLEARRDAVDACSADRIPVRTPLS